MAEITIDGRELLHSVKIGIRMPRAFGLRMWMAIRLFELAGWVSGTTVMVEIDDDVADEPAFTDAALRGEPAKDGVIKKMQSGWTS